MLSQDYPLENPIMKSPDYQHILNLAEEKIKNLLFVEGLFFNFD
jgi:hypothetical protein